MSIPRVASSSNGDADANAWVESCSVDVVDRISAIDAKIWDECSGAGNPFTRHAHLQALETSGSVCPATGFQPSHLLLLDPTGKITAVAPAYIKAHSEAELGSDMGWSMAHERFCGPYYPKLQVEVPLCPFSGPRLLARKGPAHNALRKRLLLELIALTRKLELSSVHVTYMTAEERNLATAVGMLPDRGTRFVWENDNYGDFDGYLASLGKRRRNTIRRERRDVFAEGLSFDWLTDSAITPAHIEILFNFYTNTYKKFGSKHHLTRAYFENIFQSMPKDILLILARQAGNYVGGTFFFLSPQTIFAQHWGSLEDIRFLHFETNFYQSINYALNHEKRFIDTGAGGQHKVLRGILPVDVYHAHWFRNSEFGGLISKGLGKKSRIIDQEQATLMLSSPFRRTIGEEA